MIDPSRAAEVGCTCRRIPASRASASRLADRRVIDLCARAVTSCTEVVHERGVLGARINGLRESGHEPDQQFVVTGDGNADVPVEVGLPEETARSAFGSAIASLARSRRSRSSVVRSPRRVRRRTARAPPGSIIKSASLICRPPDQHADGGLAIDAVLGRCTKGRRRGRP